MQISKQEIKNWAKAEKNINLVFGLVALAMVAGWSFWYYNTALSSVSVEVKKAEPVVQIDQNAYEVTVEYFSKIDKFKQSDLQVFYANSEPFQEYNR